MDSQEKHEAKFQDFMFIYFILYILWNQYFTVECSVKLLLIPSNMQIPENYKTCVFDRIVRNVIGLEKLSCWHVFQSQGTELLQSQLLHVLLTHS